MKQGLRNLLSFSIIFVNMYCTILYKIKETQHIVYRFHTYDEYMAICRSMIEHY